jgi:hypothetical protein
LLQLEHEQSEALHARIKADYLNGMNRYSLMFTHLVVHIMIFFSVLSDFCYCRLRNVLITLSSSKN